MMQIVKILNDGFCVVYDGSKLVFTSLVRTLEYAEYKKTCIKDTEVYLIGEKSYNLFNSCPTVAKYRLLGKECDLACLKEYILKYNKETNSFFSRKYKRLYLYDGVAFNNDVSGVNYNTLFSDGKLFYLVTKGSKNIIALSELLSVLKNRVRGLCKASEGMFVIAWNRKNLYVIEQIADSVFGKIYWVSINLGGDLENELLNNKLHIQSATKLDLGEMEILEDKRRVNRGSLDGIEVYTDIYF